MTWTANRAEEAMTHTRRAGTFIAGVLTTIALLMLASPQLLASGRDSDGSRMQAKRVDVGASESDSLSPPNDQADWRYFKLDARKSVDISVSGVAEKANVELVLTTATGSNIEATTASRGSASLKATLDPGIYYFSVSAKGSTKYTVEVR
jgi:hypothetical protein